ncbi:MAG: crossover junction endodeoxyribonuclease RuvC [Anaerolineales bacterium]|nr:crossover junction endodeoxyribonuclease RuvC [Anaerolineales bacterium]
MSRVVIGIDPGTAITGYGIVQEKENGELEWIAHGVVTTPSDWDDPKRLLELYQKLCEILSTYKPDCCAVEKLFFQKNVKTAISVGQGRGAALIAAAASELPVGEYTPLEVKQAVVGYGSADKQQVQQMVKVLLDLSEIPQPDDAADALAVAICHLHSTRRNQLLNYD